MHVYIHMHAYIHMHVYIHTHAPYACIGGFVLRGVEILDLYACTICTPYACIGGLVYVGGSRLDTAGHPQVVLVTKKLDHIWDLGV